MTARRILIVEDEDEVAEQLRLHLTHWGYVVVGKVSSGVDAIQLASELHPDMILMDIVLEGAMDGVEAAASIRSNLKIPVVYLTGCADDEFFDRASSTEPFGYMLKPIQPRELERTLRIAFYHSGLESRLSKSEQHLSDAQRVSMLGSWDWDIANNTLSWSDQMFRIFGLNPQGFGANYEAYMELVHPEDRSHVQLAMDTALANDKHFCVSYRVVTANNEIRSVHAEGEVTFDEDGLAVKMIGTTHDVSAIRQTQDELWHLAHHDALTELPNRNLLADRLALAIARAVRQRDQVAVMLLDLDHFKEVNDSFGHAVGDELLKIAASRLQAVLRDDDTLARLGGDEFVVVASGISDPSDTLKIAEKLLNSLRQPIEIEGNKLMVTTSIGITMFHAGGVDSDVLMKQADIAMYEAKRLGSNNYCLYGVDIA